MSKADELFVSMCRGILDHGTTTEGELVRPHWEDGVPAYTIKGFGVTNRYDLREEFPALTLRRTALKSAMDGVPVDIPEEVEQHQRPQEPYLGPVGR